jgi:hypothetical protein
MSDGIHICYADGKYKESQQICSQSALSVAGFTRSYCLNRSFLPQDFTTRHAHILNQPRGAGYWLWKPYIILETLLQNPGDLICYTDSGMYFVKPFVSFAEKCLENRSPIVSFDCCGTNGQFTKRDCFELMYSYTDDVRNDKQRMASVLVFRSCTESIAFVSSWLTYCLDPRILTDAPNAYGPNYPEFKDHRHDQSVFSILSRRYGTYVHPQDVTQFSNSDPYLIHHRNPR